MSTDFTLGKKERLKSNLVIQNLLKNGKTISAFPLKIYWDINEDIQQQSPVRMAVSVPRRRIRQAVDRNLLKRRLREAYRLNKSILYDPLRKKGLSVVLIILFLADEFLTYEAVESKVRDLLRRLVDNLP
jgi:ribonuclease P protein component